MSIDLFLFTSDLAFARRSFAAGITAFVLDWESYGKRQRQQFADTDIHVDTPQDVQVISQITDARRVCRINQFGAWTRQEVEAAIAAGTTHLLLPMVETPQQVESVLRFVDGRVKVGILVETSLGCSRAQELATLPLDLVYVGLNDLAISRGTKNIFAPLADGLAMRLRECFVDIPFGLGGLTVVSAGTPIPCLELMAELARLRCDFTFLRRSFKRDIVGRNMCHELKQIAQHWQRLSSRPPEQVERDHHTFMATYLAVRRSGT